MATGKYSYSVLYKPGKKDFGSIETAEAFAKGKDVFAIKEYGTGKWKEAKNFKLGKKKTVYAVAKPDGKALYAVEKSLRKAVAAGNDIVEATSSLGIPLVPCIYEVKEADGSFVKVAWKHK